MSPTRMSERMSMARRVMMVLELAEAFGISTSPLTSYARRPSFLAL
jgi:hypothetical protein